MCARKGVAGTRLRAYCSNETHTWIQKAADISGLGTDAIRWIPADSDARIRPGCTARADRQRRSSPATSHSWSSAMRAPSAQERVDPLPELAAICREFDIWFHVDGAYGAMAAVLPDAPAEFARIDARRTRWPSIPTSGSMRRLKPAVLWCAMCRNLRDAFSYHPAYYHFGDEAINYFDLGPQNSRGFRALKVWLALQQVGRDGYVQMISDDIRLSRTMYERIAQTAELEALTQGLSITTFRFVPSDLKRGDDGAEKYLDDLNRELLTRLQQGGEVYPSNAVVHGKFALRCCIVNFRTTPEDIEALLPIVVNAGKALDAEMRPTIRN